MPSTDVGLTTEGIERMFDPAPEPGTSDVGKRREGPAQVRLQVCAQQSAFPRLPERRASRAKDVALRARRTEGSLRMPAFLARRYDEPVDVERRDDVPVAFVRKGRRYTVRAVLGHWWQTAPWWETADLTVGAVDDERELWRVEPSAAGRSVAVVELCLSWMTGRWTLTAVLD